MSIFVDHRRPINRHGQPANHVWQCKICGAWSNNRAKQCRGSNEVKGCDTPKAEARMQTSLKDQDKSVRTKTMLTNREQGLDRHQQEIVPQLEREQQFHVPALNRHSGEATVIVDDLEITADRNFLFDIVSEAINQ